MVPGLPNDGGTCPSAVCPLFSFYHKLNTNSTNFDGEILAIFLSLQNLLYCIQKFTKVVILCDSKAAILAITQDRTPKSLNIIECRKLIKQLSYLHKKKLYFNGSRPIVEWKEMKQLIFWPKRLAKLSQTQLILPFPFTLSKELYWINISIDLGKNTPLKHLERNGKIDKLTTTLQRKSAVATFRLLTGHDCLYKHLHRFGIANSPKCSFCNLNEDMERNHLLHCPAFIEETNLPGKYWSARERMISLSSARH